MNERIKELRKCLKLSQEEFGKLLGITKSGVSDIESGRRNVTDQHIIMLKTHNVNEQWLRNGTGTMFIERTRNQVITDFMGDLIVEPEAFKTRLIEGLAKLDESDWEEIEKLVLKIIHKKES